MNKLDPLDEWREAKRAPPAPTDFSARVMDSVRREAHGERGLWSGSWFQAGAWAAASLILLVRLAALVAVLWPN